MPVPATSRILVMGVLRLSCLQTVAKHAIPQSVISYCLIQEYPFIYLTPMLFLYVAISIAPNSPKACIITLLILS